MKHNQFRFTIKCLTGRDDSETKEVLAYFSAIVEDLPHEQAEMIYGIAAATEEPEIIFTYLTLEVRDYGVEVVGVTLVSNFIKYIYEDSYEDRGFHIDTTVIHPQQNGKGAIIRWDYDAGEPIVEEISEHL